MSKKNKLAAKSAKTTKVEKPEVTVTNETKPEGAVEQPENKEVPEQKPEQKPESKPKSKANKKSTEKVEDVVAEPITPTVQTGVTGMQSVCISKIAKGDRIDANHSVDLMKLVHSQYLINSDVPEQLRKAMNEQFNVMMLANLIHWNEQTKLDFGEAGIEVNKAAFDMISEGLETYFGMNVKGIPSKENEGQLQLKFAEEMPEQTKKDLEASKHTKVAKELPEYNPEMDNDQIVKAMETILNMRESMGKNLINTISFAKKAYQMDKSTPAEILQKILTEIPDNLLLNSYARMIYGAVVKNDCIFNAHAALRNHLAQAYDDKQLVNIGRLFFARGVMISKGKNDSRKFDEVVKPWNGLFNSMNDEIINKLIASQKDKEITIEVPSVKGIAKTSDNFNCEKIMKALHDTYGTDIGDKLLKSKMQEISNGYRDIDKVTLYDEPKK